LQKRQTKGEFFTMGISILTLIGCLSQKGRVRVDPDSHCVLRTLGKSANKVRQVTVPGKARYAEVTILADGAYGVRYIDETGEPSGEIYPVMFSHHQGYVCDQVEQGVSQGSKVS
jgi:hypothetical protein